MRFFLLSVFLFSSIFCKAQLQGQPLIDSLLKKLPLITEDSNRIKILNWLAFTYKTINPNEGVRYALQQIELSKALGKQRAVASGYNVLGLNYQYKSDYTKALECYHKALLFFADKPDYISSYGNIISNIAYVYQAQGNLDKALEYNFKSLKINQQLNDSTNIGGDYGNIGIIYLNKKEYDKALEYDFMSLDIFEKLKDKDNIARNYGNIGNVYREMKNYINALEYDTKALELFRQLGDNGGVAINLGNIGTVYFYIALEMDSIKQTGRILPKGTKSLFLARSVDYLKQSIALSEQIGQLDNIIEFSENLHEVYLELGNTALALESFKKCILYRDSVYSEENKLEIANLESMRELALKDKQIQIDALKLEQKRNERIILIIALVLLLVVMGIVIRSLWRQKKYNLQLAKEKKGHLDRIEKQKMVMGHIAYTHSHEVSGQVATILGLVEVFNADDYTDPDNKVVIDGIAETAHKLDVIVKDMIINENRLNG